MLYVDKREPEKLRRFLCNAATAKSIPLTEKFLPFGDYVIDNGTKTVAIERKQIGDFAGSWTSGRLDTQLNGCRRDYDIVYLLIEEYPQYYTSDSNMYLALPGHKTKISFLAVEDYLASLHPHVGVVKLPSSLHSLTWILGQYRMLTGPEKIRFDNVPKILPISNTLPVPCRVLLTVPGVGPKAAIALVKEFKSIRAIVEADDKQLRAVEGIGNTTVMNIRAYLNLEVGDEQWEKVKSSKPKSNKKREASGKRGTTGSSRKRSTSLPQLVLPQQAV